MALNKNLLFVLTLVLILASLNLILAESPRVGVSTNLNLTINLTSNNLNPEAIIKYDPGLKDLIITDLNSNPIQFSSEKCLDHKCLRKVRTYVIQGIDNDSLVLTLNYLKLNSEVSISVLNMSYGSRNIKFKSGSNLIKIKFPWTNREFSEKLIIGKTNLNINYNLKKDYTKVQINSPGKINITKNPGIVIADLRTNNGSLEYSLY